MSAGMRRLLSYIVAHYVAEDEQRAIDRSASAQVQGAELEADKAAAVRRERADADSQADAFARGLELALDRYRDGQDTVSFDDRDPRQNAMASALVDYLVRFGLATSTVRELGGQHYIYDITVDWDRLHDVAEANSQRLDDLFDTPREQPET